MERCPHKTQIPKMNIHPLTMEVSRPDEKESAAATDLQQQLRKDEPANFLFIHLVRSFLLME